MLPKEFLRKKGSSQFETTDSGMDRRQFWQGVSAW
jgi:hypothetical protein